MKSLIVEDVAIIRKILFHYLNPLGLCDCATDGLEGLGKFCLAYANNQPYNLILLDIMLLRINGLELLTKIRTLEQEVTVADKSNTYEPAKIIMVSSLSDEKVVAKSVEQGCNGYITKPFDKDKIINEIGKVGL